MLSFLVLALAGTSPALARQDPVLEQVESLADKARELIDKSIKGLGPSQEQSSPVAVDAGKELLQTKFENCPQFFVPGYLPKVPSAPGLRELCFTAFAILHSGQTKTPVFVVQRLNRDILQRAQKVERSNRFYEEARLPSKERAKLSDYKGSGYSRGHMAPAADMDSPQAMAQSFSLANMVPQDQQNNSGVWARIEQDTRKYIQRAQGDVYVFTGPVFDDNPKVIGAGKVAVPAYLFKLVYDPQAGKAWAYWQGNHKQSKVDTPISYAEFVRRTGLHLLPDEMLGK